MKQTAESIEAESARIRSQLAAVGADLRHHADPSVIVNAATSSFKRRVDDAPAFLKKNATPIGLVVLGGALGAVLTGVFSPSRRERPVASTPSYKSSSNQDLARPSARSQLKAAALSTLAVGLGYVAGMFVPASSTEDRLFGRPKAVLSEGLDAFLKEHLRGVKLAAANMFGASRLSATALIGLAMLAEALGTPQRRAKPDFL